MKKPNAQYAVCINNNGYEASLEVRKIYRVRVDAKSAAMGLLRVRDESGQQYLYPTTMFAAIRLPHNLVKALALAA